MNFKYTPAGKLLSRIMHPSSPILNPKNQNHYVAMVRGYAEADGWDKDCAKSLFCFGFLKYYFDAGYTPKEAFETYKKEFEQPINQQL